MGAKTVELAYWWKAYNKIRPRRFTKKHHKYIEEALRYINKKQTVVAYTIEKTWDLGSWEGYYLDILLEDDDKMFGMINLDIQSELWEHMDDMFKKPPQHDLFCLIQVDTFHAGNYELLRKQANIECHWVLSNANIEVVL